MSTRATIHFKATNDPTPSAIIYRHSDGYPEGLGEDLKAFLNEIAGNLTDTRFADPSYLAAKWVVWDSQRNRESHNALARKCNVTKEFKSGKMQESSHLCDFLGVGIVSSDPGDIEYRYTVHCKQSLDLMTGADKTLPEITVEEV